MVAVLRKPQVFNRRRNHVKKIMFASLGLAVLAGCASIDQGPAGVREETYTPLGTFVPRKSQGPDDRKFVDKEEFKRQQEMTAAIQEQK
jgi:hypothetical protein